MSGSQAWIGTCGWNYGHWRERFYPKDLRKADWLSHYANQFSTVEINNTFYRIPKAGQGADWAKQTPGRFRFAVKMWRGVSHFKKLKDCREQLQKFFDPVSSLESKHRGPILVQLPPNQGKDLAKLDAFLAELKEVTRPARWKIAVEFRNREWLCPKTYNLLNRRRAAICLHDMPPADVSEPNDASFVYLRRHGPTGNYQDSYSEQDIREDARHIRRWLEENRMVFIYYNNDAEANAVRDAGRLQGTLEGSC